MPATFYIVNQSVESSGELPRIPLAHEIDELRNYCQRTELSVCQVKTHFYNTMAAYVSV